MSVCVRPSSLSHSLLCVFTPILNVPPLTSTPIHPKHSQVGHWADDNFKHAFVKRCFNVIDEFCPGFSSSVIGYDALSPLDLERIFGLHKGNIMHGALSLHQLAHARPAPGWSSHRTPLDGLYLCGAGAHPGGGVMGAAGRNCANVVLSDLGMD